MNENEKYSKNKKVQKYMLMFCLVGAGFFRLRLNKMHIKNVREYELQNVSG